MAATTPPSKRTNGRHRNAGRGTQAYWKGNIVIRKFVAMLVTASALGALWLGTAATASANMLPNGLSWSLRSSTPESLLVTVCGNPRVGDYVTLTINVRVDTNPQFERSTEYKCGSFIVDRLHLYPRTVYVQACRKRSFGSSLCTAWSSFEVGKIGFGEYPR
jgi:hypothetical protein